MLAKAVEFVSILLLLIKATQRFVGFKSLDIPPHPPHALSRPIYLAFPFGYAFLQSIFRDASVSARVNQNGLVGLALRFLLFSGVNLTLGIDIDGKNFSAGGHKVGANIQFE